MNSDQKLILDLQARLKEIDKIAFNAKMRMVVGEQPHMPDGDVVRIMRLCQNPYSPRELEEPQNGRMKA